MIITKELVVSGKRRPDIVAELRSLKFRPFPKKERAKEEGENMAAEEEEGDEGQASDYDYLLGMAIWSLTSEKVRLSKIYVQICNWRGTFRLRSC